METPPASALKLPQPHLLLEVLVVALNTPAHLGLEHHALQRHVLIQRGQPVLHRLFVAFGPLDEKPLFAPLLRALLLPMGRPHTNPCKAGAQSEVAAFAPLHVMPLRRRQVERHFLDRLRTLVLGRPQSLARGHGTTPTVGRRRQRRTPGRPHRHLTRHAHHITQAQLAQTLSKRRVHAVARVGQQAVLGRALLDQLRELCQRYRRLGGELDVLRHTGTFAARQVVGPFLGQVQPPSHRQAARLAGQRHTHRNLTVILLAQHAAVLPGHADRVRALLGKTGVVHDPPAATREVHRRHDPLRDTQQHLLVRPGRVGHEVVQRLVSRAGGHRCQMRRHRLHTLALQRCHQPGAISAQTGVPVYMTQAITQVRHVAFKLAKLFHQGSPLA